MNALTRLESRVGLCINIDKTKEIRVKERCRKPLVLNDVIEQLGSFTFLRTMVNKEGGSLEDVKSRIKRANGVFVQLYLIRKNKNLS
jgi:hypothetical protein